MLFNSVSFAVFLPIVFAIYWCMPKRSQWIVLFAASYYFYMSWNAAYVTLILFTTVISYLCALLLARAKTTRQKKVYVTLALVTSLGVLFVYKYFAFFFAGLDAICSAFAIPLTPITLNLLLPVGISFYTFQTLSYVIDVYRGKVAPERHFGRYATFVSFFPQLVAGPIERTDNLLPQIKAQHSFSYEQGSYGTKLMAWGFFKKIVIADTIAVYVDTVYNNLSAHQGFAMVVAVVLFTLQIYCDFSGYSDIAIGVAKLFGIDLMTNFKSPYFATSIGEFWSRWHISLSTWFRDYLYIPLGGNRCSQAKNMRNVLVTFLVSGLWHGANITFVVWGALHGLAQVMENLCKQKAKRNHKNNENESISRKENRGAANVPHAITAQKAAAQKSMMQKEQGKEQGKDQNAIKHPATSRGGLLWWAKCAAVFVFCNLAWVFFRADTISGAIYLLSHALVGIANPAAYVMDGLILLGLYLPELIGIALPVCLLLAYDYIQLSQDPIALLSRQKTFVRWPVYIIIVVMVLLSPAESNAFVYFQF